MRSFPSFLLFTVLLAFVCGTATASTPVPISEDLRIQMNVPLGKRLESLLENKTSDGFHYHQGSFAQSFRKVDDETYQVTFTERIATATRMTAKRYLLTLKKTGERKWDIAEEELQDTFDGLWRTYPSADFRSFDSISFDREGMKITGGKGQLFFNIYNDQIYGIVAVADNMKYEYSVPRDVRFTYYQEVQENIRNRFKSQLDFDPSWIEIDCDPTTCQDLMDNMFSGLEDRSVPELPENPPWIPEGSSSGVDGRLYERFSKFGKSGKKSYRDLLDANAFRNFDVPYREDRRELSIGLYDKSDDNGIFLQIDNYEPLEVRFGVSFEGFHTGWIFNYNSEDVRKAGVDPYEIERRPDLDGRDFEIATAHVEADCALEDPEVLVARVRYTINLKQDLTELSYNLYTYQRSTEAEERQNPSLRIGYMELNGEEVTVIPTGPYTGVVPFPEKIPAGSTIELYTAYSNRSIRKFTHSYSYLPRGGWLPFVRFTDKIEDFDMTVRVPSEYKTLGVGYLAESSTEDGVTTTHWDSDSPVSFPTIIFGKYFEGTPAEEIKVVKSDGTEVPVTVHVDEANKADWQIRGKQLTPIANQAASALDFYRAMSGVDYPYKTLNLVNDTGQFRGQAPASIVYLGGAVFRGEGLVGSFGGSDLSKFNKSVVAHEVGHQWWGAVVGNANRRNYWFVESLAEYFAALWLEQMYGHKEYQEHVEEWRRKILETELMASVQRSDVDYKGEFEGMARQALVYYKGAFTFHILRQTFGDEKFFPFLKAFTRELAEKSEVVTLDLQRAAEKHLGGVGADGQPYTVDLGWFFDQWIRGIGTPEYSFNYSTRQNEDGRWLVEGTLNQRIMYGSKTDKKVMDGVFYRGVVPITVLGKKDQEYKKRLIVEGPETPFRLLLPERPLEVVLNKDQDILAFDILDNKPFR